MPDQPPEYGLLESEEFSKSAEKLDSYERIDDALVSVTDVLCVKPHIYPIVEGMKEVRLCKTDDAGDVPGLRFWFRIKKEEKMIELLEVERIDDHED